MLPARFQFPFSGGRELRALGGNSFDVVSAGSEETPLDSEAVAVMREVGVDISGSNEGGKPLSRASPKLRGYALRFAL